MSQWTNEYAILRDLSMAQGRVPVAIEMTVGAGDKPPSLNITEDTEEEYFKHCSADANVTAAPDLGLIQKMLDMVRDTDDFSNDEDSNKVIVISKLNPNCPEFKPKQEDTSTPTHPSPTKKTKEKKRRQRNIALESILQAIEDNKIQNKEIVLRKPNEFIAKVETFEIKEPEVQKSKEINDSNDSCENSTPTVVEKVTGWLETQTGSPFPKKTSKVTLDATNIVFRKKVKKTDKQLKDVKWQERSSTPSSNSGEYKPSTLANEYYLKYIERNKFKESVKQNIWTRAEQKMKEIDEKRRREAMQHLTSPSSASPASGLNLSFEETQNTDAMTERIVAETRISRCLELIGLPQHRHQLAENCIVCELVNKPRVPEQPSTSSEETEGKPTASSTESTDVDGDDNSTASAAKELVAQN